MYFKRPNRRPSINIRRDTNKEMAFDVSSANLSELLKKLDKSDQVWHQLNKSDREMSIIKIPKSA